MNFRGERRTNATHRSVTDPEARLAGKGDGALALLSHAGHVLMETRHGLCIGVSMTEANGHAERPAAGPLLRQVRRRLGPEPATLGADTGYVVGEFLRDLEETKHVVLHVPVPDGPIRGGYPEGPGAAASAPRDARGGVGAEPTDSQAGRRDL